ncbi:MAG: hypothetical protein ACE5EO_04780 [Candidatus Krumholzibacteriia bacterium]
MDAHTLALNAIDRVTESIYESICFRKGGEPDLAQLQRLFIPEGTLINNNDDSPVIMSVDQFIEALRLQITNGSLEALHETELAGHTKVFGKIAQRLSIYEARMDPDQPDILSRSVNSIQFIQTSGVWRVASLIWHDETDEHTIPGDYA